MTTLHIYLQSDPNQENFEPLHFGPKDFQPLQEAHPNLELVFLHSTQEMLEQLANIEWLDTWYFDRLWYNKAPKLRGIFTPAAGKNWVHEDPSAQVRTHYGSFHGPMIAETMLSYILHFSRNLPAMIKQQSDNTWDRTTQRFSRLLKDQTALILGYGNIGQHCGALLTSMGLTVHGYQRAHRFGQDNTTGVIYIDDSQLDSIVSTADHVINLLPGDPSTNSFIDQRFLEKMHKDSFLYNFGRGTTVCETSLLWALNNEIIAGAALDVTAVEPLPDDSPLWQLPNILITPHSSCVYSEYQSLHVQQLIDLIKF